MKKYDWNKPLNSLVEINHIHFPQCTHTKKELNPVEIYKTQDNLNCYSKEENLYKDS